MSEIREKKQILRNVADMIAYLEKSISENQKGIQDAEKRIDLAHAEIDRSTAEIKKRVKDGEELAQKLAVWKQQQATLEAL